jgi:hypothetical protein
VGGGCRVHAARAGDTWSALGQSSPTHPGSCALLVIQGSWSIIATREEKVAHSEILINQWRNESSAHDLLGHPRAFTKSDEEPTSFTSVGNETDRVMAAAEYPSGRA